MQLMIVVLAEHILFVVKMLLAVLIKDKPQWIIDEEHNMQR